jgi:hypothetical protein
MRPKGESASGIGTRIVERRETRKDAQDRIEAEKLTPSSDVLREMARKSPPPPEWWDEDFEGL